ncbi:MAG: lysophospholipid acyltransferase family protein [bacterium]
MIRRFISESIIKALFARRLANVSGHDNVPEGPIILATNHIDWLDWIIVFLSVAQLKPKRKLYIISKTKNYWIIGDQAIPMSKSYPADSLRLAQSKLTGQAIMSFYIEGRRNNSPELQPGKTGCARLALMTGLPVVPMGIIGPSYPSYSLSMRHLFNTLKNTQINFGSPLQWPKQTIDVWDEPLLRTKTREIMNRLAPLCFKKYPF